MFTYGYAMAIFVLMMNIHIKNTPSPLNFLGDTSYSLYLLHLPVGSLVLAIAVTARVDFTSASVRRCG